LSSSIGIVFRLWASVRGKFASVNSRRRFIESALTPNNQPFPEA
jgi:hypothetical protein